MWPLANWSSAMRCSPRTPRATGPQRTGNRAVPRPASTSSTCATGSPHRPRDGSAAAQRPRHPCPTTSSPGPASGTSRPTSRSPAPPSTDRITAEPRSPNPGVAPMARVVVEVMPKPEILDPQGKAVAAALPRLGFEAFTSVRQGKRFELEVEGEASEEVLAQAGRAAGEVLSNPVIEDVVSVHVLSED